MAPLLDLPAGGRLLEPPCEEARGQTEGCLYESRRRSVGDRYRSAGKRDGTHHRGVNRAANEPPQQSHARGQE